jgi:Caspase domain
MFKLRPWALLALFLIIVCNAAHAEETAIVVGIGDYVNLPADSHLDGIENDVKAMETVLKKASFHVISLFNAQATEAGIRQAFAQAGRLVQKGDRFVYYQSSHGSRDYHLLTYDTSRQGGHTLSKQDILELMNSIPTQRKSLLLDACFSGGFTKDRGVGFRQVKFYPISSLVDAQKQTIQDRTDTVVRTIATANAAGARREFVVFASSQDNQTSLVGEIDGRPASVFTHFLSTSLSMHQNAAWNEVVQATISAVIQQTNNQQTPAFDSGYLSFQVYTTDRRVGETNGTTTTAVHNLRQVYDLINCHLDRLSLSASMGNDRPAPDELYHPGTQVKLDLHVSLPGYLFVINRDDKDNAQLVGWGTQDLSLNQPEAMVDQSYLARPEEFEFGKGTLKITTSQRQGTECWKAFLFTNREDAVTFAQLWAQLPTDQEKRVHLNAFANAKLDTVLRIGISSPQDSRTLYTSEVHYRVTDR